MFYENDTCRAYSEFLFVYAGHNVFEYAGQRTSASFTWFVSVSMDVGTGQMCLSGAGFVHAICRAILQFCMAKFCLIC